MKNIALIQHTNETSPGIILPWLELLKKQQKILFQHFNLEKGDGFPNVGEFDGFILCGGGIHPDQDEKYPILKTERELIKSVIKENKKLLGLCLGAQVCAQVLGAKVYPHPKGWEIGWHDVDVMNEKIRAFQFHRYVFDLPSGAVCEASNSWWQNQGFLWKNQILAYQFHPEADVPWILDCATEPELNEKGQIQEKSALINETENSQKKIAVWFLSKLTDFFKIDNPI